jgi:GntR family transcriptional regulator / MocR family aminotransferase
MLEITPVLDVNRKEPLYLQLYTYIKDEIYSGNIAPSIRLPSVRKLSDYLQVSRNTVEAAYQQLVAEGYVESRPRSGLYVAPMDKEPLFLQNSLPVPSQSGNEWSRNEAGACLYDFKYGTIDPDSFPYAAWRKAINQCVHPDEQELLFYGEPIGEYGLRAQIASYLRQARGVSCCAEQIVLGAGTQQSLGMVCQLLGADKRKIAMEEPGYDGARIVFENCGWSTAPIPLEDDGLSLEKLEKSEAKLVYVTPSHQFPYGMVMSITKRLKLLQWARECGGIIIEDDYDGEFRYTGKPIPSLQGLDAGENVIYMGTFSKSLLPSLRISYIVLPRRLMEEYKRKFGAYGQPVSRMQQKALQLFMESGEWERHIRRVRNIYHKRNFALLESIKTIMQEKVRIIGKDSGLHMLLEVRSRRSEEELIEAAEKYGVKVYPTSRYWVHPPKMEHPFILLGFGGLSEEKIEQGIRRLHEAWFS